MVRHILVKFSDIEFNKNRFRFARVVPCVQTDIYIYTKEQRKGKSYFNTLPATWDHAYGSSVIQKVQRS
jgi:hypothetical protein